MEGETVSTSPQPLKPRCLELPSHYLCTPGQGRQDCVISILKGVLATRAEKRQNSTRVKCEITRINAKQREKIEITRKSKELKRKLKCV